MRRDLACLLLASVGVHARALAQEPAMRRIEARVTALSGASVYLDIGSDSGAQPGDRARALPVGGGAVELVVRAVSRQSARCEPVSTLAGLDVGSSVDVFVPESRAGANAQSNEHPPWTQPTEAWSADTPLLAPAQSHTAADREKTLSGRWFTSFDPTWESESDSQRYWLARTGLELELDNATGRGDALHFDGELWARNAELGDGQDDSESHVRVDRLSWRLGGTRDDPDRLELGRFLHSQMPQLGVVDGVEYVQRLNSGDRFGASVGFLPEWTPEMATGDDAQVSLFYRHVVGAMEELSLGAALQKTWHEGESDRDLALFDASWRPSPKLSLYASLWVDYYDSNDAPKSSGFELTEALASATYRFGTDAGVGLSLAHIRWPVLLRNELPPVTLATLADGQVDRGGVNGWKYVTKNTRLYGRFDLWQSDSDSGQSGEASYSIRDWLYTQGEVSLALFASDGQYSSLLGTRVAANKSAPSGFWTLAWEAAQHEQDGFDGSQAELLQQVLRASWDGEIGQGWDLSLGLDQRFGDEQGSTSLGFFLQRRF